MKTEGRDALLSYGTATELVQALQARKISALELTDYVIARIEKLDGKLNAVVVRDFERGRATAKAADAALARGERRPLLGIPMVVRILRRRRPADDLGRAAVQGLDCAGGRNHGRPRQGGRHRDPRQDQRAVPFGRLAEPQRDLRRDQKSLGSHPHARRLLGRIVRRACRRLRAALARLGYRRLVAHAGVLLRHLRAQADARPCADGRTHRSRHRSARERTVRGRTDGAQRRRSLPDARRNRRS